MLSTEVLSWLKKAGTGKIVVLTIGSHPLDHQFFSVASNILKADTSFSHVSQTLVFVWTKMPALHIQSIMKTSEFVIEAEIWQVVLKEKLFLYRAVSQIFLQILEYIRVHIVPQKKSELFSDVSKPGTALSSSEVERSILQAELPIRRHPQPSTLWQEQVYFPKSGATGI